MHFTVPTTRASRPDDALLRFGGGQWRSLIAQLCRRGAGRHEAGAFLLAANDGDQHTVRDVLYFDDLDPHSLGRSIHIGGLAFSRLWDFCDAGGLMVAADVHTHPASWVGLSMIDAANPMVARVGHVAIIVPAFARSPVTTRDIGVHLYLGAAGWTSWAGPQAARRVKVGRWR